jgi:hypothetical protein
MSAQQQQINYGNTANDGQGDPLRTAFIKTDDNFDAIWNAGPVGSNVTILNNTISVADINGNLVLSPNGVGVIQTNNSVIPRLANSYDLGSANLRYRSAYIGSGGLSATGNITANTFFGNGSQLTGIASSYGNANVATFLAAFGSNTISTTGNISGNNIIPAADVVADLGSPTNQWKNLYVGGGVLGQVYGDGINVELTLKSPPGVGDTGYVALSSANEQNYVEVSNIGIVLAVKFGQAGFKKLEFDNTGNLSAPGTISATNVNATTSVGLPVYATDAARDSAIPSPQPGMMVFVTGGEGQGLQVRGATAWNPVTGTAT